ncbi:MAG: hypothetical protein ABSA78_18405 [Candidatus Sulfotelmatobacter sp.]
MNNSSELPHPFVETKRDWPLILGLATVGITLLGLLPAYFIFWHRSDVVFDKRAVEIPLSGPLRKTIESALSQSSHKSDSISVTKNGLPLPRDASQLPSTTLPDRLLYVNIRNVGKIPSSLIKVQIRVPGIIADRDVSGGGPVLGDITAQQNTSNGVYFECPNLANADGARLKVALWYQQTDSYTPSVQIIETAEGPSREVGSVETASFYLLDLATHRLWIWALEIVAFLVLPIQLWLLLKDLREYGWWPFSRRR